MPLDAMCFYNLATVAVPSVSVEGEKAKQVMAGSPVQLKCFIRNCLKQPTYVFWYKYQIVGVMMLQGKTFSKKVTKCIHRYLFGSRLDDASGHIKVTPSLFTTKLMMIAFEWL